MSDQLDVPSELQHLIEKRELEDRRMAERRAETERSAATPQADSESAPTESPTVADCHDEPETDRRTGDDRRQDVRRAADRGKA